MTRAERLAMQAAKINQNLINNLEDKQTDINILENLKNNITAVTQKQVIDDSWLGTIAGRISGIMHHIVYNPKYTTDLCIIIDIKTSVLEQYKSIAPQLPYIDKNQEVIEGQFPKLQEFKDLLLYLANNFQVVLDDEELNKITDESFEKIYNKKMEAVKRTMDLAAGLGFNYDE